MKPSPLVLNASRAEGAAFSADTESRSQPGIASNSKAASHHFDRGNAMLARGKLNEAERCYRRALVVAPQAVEIWSNLGCALWRSGKLADAESCLTHAVSLRPTFAEAQNNLAGVLEAQGRLEEALTRYRSALVLKPDYAHAHCNLGGVLHRLGRFNEAMVEFARAVKLQPSLADAWSNLGSTMLAIGNIADAENYLRCAVEISPGHRAALTSLADVLRMQGKFDEAIATYRKAIAIDKNNSAAKVKLALAQEVIFDTREKALCRRAEVIDTLAELSREGLQLTDPAREVGMTNFYFAYQGMDDVDLQTKIAQFYLRACPKLGWTAPHCTSSSGAQKDRLRLGIVSTCLFDHTIGKFYQGLIQKISRDRFEVVVLRPPHNDDKVAEAIGRDADSAVELPHDLYPARERIASQQLDILFYPDIGMAPLTYFLAFARLAPVQCVSWGHPVTTGIPAMDYFISAKGLEAAEAQEHYSERLVMLKRLPTFYSRPRHSAAAFTRVEFGFDDDATLYLCPQSLFKLHPDFDLVIATLLRRDPSSRLLLISGLHRHWDRLLGARIAKRFPDVAERVAFVPRIRGAEFFRLLSMADVILDPPYFGGGNTSYEAFAMGLPIVTWPGPFMRGRVTDGCYRQMGYTGLVADSLESYVELALRLGNDRAWRTRVRGEIGECAAVLYEDASAVTELEDFLRAAWEAHRRGERIAEWGT